MVCPDVPWWWSPLVHTQHAACWWRVLSMLGALPAACCTSLLVLHFTTPKPLPAAATPNSAHHIPPSPPLPAGLLCGESGAALSAGINVMVWHEVTVGICQLQVGAGAGVGWWVLVWRVLVRWWLVGAEGLVGAGCWMFEC